MTAAFPMYQDPLLADCLSAKCGREIGGVVAELGATCTDDEDLITVVVERLKATRIELGERFYERGTWKRPMISTSSDVSLLRRGIRPGQTYTQEYAVYRIEIASGAEFVTCGANGGPMIDPTFMLVEGGQVVLRAASDQHRDELLRELDQHVERANRVIDEWNATGLPQAVRREVAVRNRGEQERQQRSAQLEATGFRPIPTGSDIDSRTATPDRPRPAATREPSCDVGPPAATAAERMSSRDQGAGEASDQADRSRELAPPTVLISWAHGDTNFTEAQRAARESNVADFANALRENGIDADIDLFHQHEAVDWTRWGPGRMREVDFVIVLCSEGWKRAWEDDSSPGVTAEADTLKSWFQRRRDRFECSVRLVILPGEEPVIPEGLDRLPHYRIRSLDRAGLEPLLRSLTDQPEYIPTPVGSRPLLPPRGEADAMRAESSMSQRTIRTPHGELIIAQPHGLPAAVQRVIDDFVTAEQRDFEQSEGTAANLASADRVVANYSSITFTLELDADELVSYVADCEYILPGSATSYQRTVGLTFRRSDGRHLTLADVLIEAPENLRSLHDAFVASARAEFGDAADKTSMPSGATFAVRSDSLGVCTSRYDIGPGYLGAPVVWIPHGSIALLYRPEFVRVLPVDET